MQGSVEIIISMYSCEDDDGGGVGVRPPQVSPQDIQSENENGARNDTAGD